MKTSDFSRIRFIPQYRNLPKRFNPSCEAFDTETEKGDIRTLACSHEGMECDHTIDALNFLMERAKSINFLYNLDYDVSAIMRPFIVETGQATSLNGYLRWDVGAYNVEYLPGKHMTVRNPIGRRRHRFYDLAQFYNFTPLGKLAETYLHRPLSSEMKEDRAKLFELHSMEEIIRYCIEDARATKDLGELFIKANVDMGVKSDRYYSTAALSQKAFMAYSDYPVHTCAWRFLHRLGFNSYRGGWFDMYRRGHFDGAYAYDIVSAYPSAMRNLPDLRDGEWVPYISKRAEMGFVKCTIESQGGMDDALPVSVKSEGRNLYPYYDSPREYTLTLPEYRAMRDLYRIEVLGASSFIARENARKPFRLFVDKFFEIKSKSKGIARMNAKIYLNSLYGKTVQLVPFRGDFRTSALTNFIYGSHITADCRVKVMKAAKGAKIIQILTDSLITENPLKLDFGNNLGQWEPKIEGDELLSVKCGIYAYKKEGKWIDAETHTRGFAKSYMDDEGVKRYNTLADILAGDMRAHERRPWKIRSAMTQGKSGKIAAFEKFSKKISLNETKRMFDSIKPSEMLESSQDSLPIPTSMMDERNHVVFL